MKIFKNPLTTMFGVAIGELIFFGWLKSGKDKKQREL